MNQSHPDKMTFLKPELTACLTRKIITFSNRVEKFIVIACNWLFNTNADCPQDCVKANTGL